VVVCAWRLRPASLYHNDPAAVGIDDIVESKEIPRAPTNQRASDLVEHGFDLDVARRESRGSVKESIADFLGLEVSGGPRNEIVTHDGLWSVVMHEIALWGGSRLAHGEKDGWIDASDTLPMPSPGRGVVVEFEPWASCFSGPDSTSQCTVLTAHLVVAPMGMDDCRQGRHVPRAAC
jgi:hypothetical protein